MRSFRIFAASFAVALLTTTALAWAAAGRAEAGPRRVGQTTIVSETALRRLKANKGVSVQWLWGSKPGPLQVMETPEGVRLMVAIGAVYFFFHCRRVNRKAETVVETPKV